ncbi:MAG: HAMP domain-containing sensor histidine kinase [Vicinamibacterales bacterium]
MAVLSLRTRVLLGAVLWTAGLFAVTGLVTTHLMLRYPSAPRILHGFFEHAIAWSVVALVCMVVGLWQVRRGLAPLQELRARLGDVRAGRHVRVVGEYPNEVQPLVGDLNALLDHRARTVARALARAGDLAHGLKTPLAVLSQEAERVAAAGDAELAASVAQQVERMHRHVEYHLAHARAAASGASTGAHASVRRSAEALSRTLLRLHAGRGVALAVDVPSDLEVRCEPEDVDEILGNVLDNAFKWARSRVRVTASAAGERVAVTVEDDGPGLAPELWEAVLQRGVRADEAAPGSGLGLAIVREMVELYGGAIVLGRGDWQGLRVSLSLPAAGASSGKT